MKKEIIARINEMVSFQDFPAEKKATLEKIRDNYDALIKKTPDAQQRIEKSVNEVYDSFKKSIVTTKQPAKHKAPKAAPQPKAELTAEQKERNADNSSRARRAAELIKQGVTYKEAYRQAKEEHDAAVKEMRKRTQNEIDKLNALIARKPSIKNLAVNIERDAARKALRPGKRISKDGNTYYEHRNNRVDFRKGNRYPLLKDGGPVGETMSKTVYKGKDGLKYSAVTDRFKMWTVVCIDGKNSSECWDDQFGEEKAALEVARLLSEGKNVEEYYGQKRKLSDIATYVPNRDIKDLSVMLHGQLKKLKGKDILDGVYVKKDDKPSTPEDLYETLKEKLKDFHGEYELKDLQKAEVKKLVEAGLSDEMIDQIYFGYVQQGVNADVETCGKLLNLTPDGRAREIDRVIENFKAGVFEAGLKYPDFDWSAIIKKYKISLKPQLVENNNTRWKTTNFYQVFQGEGVVIGNEYAYQNEGEKKRDEGNLIVSADKQTAYQKERGIPAGFNGNYWGIVSHSQEVVTDILKMLLSQKDGYVKSIEFPLNTLGGISNDDVKGKFKYADGGDVGKNGYVAFYKNKQMDVYANTTLEAQRMAANLFGAKKPWEVTVVLAEKDGKQVEHAPMFAKGGDIDSDDNKKMVQAIKENQVVIVKPESKKGASDEMQLFSITPAKMKDGGPVAHRSKQRSQKHTFTVETLKTKYPTPNFRLEFHQKEGKDTVTVYKNMQLVAALTQQGDGYKYVTQTGRPAARGEMTTMTALRKRYPSNLFTFKHSGKNLRITAAERKFAVLEGENGKYQFVQTPFQMGKMDKKA